MVLQLFCSYVRRLLSTGSTASSKFRPKAHRSPFPIPPPTNPLYTPPGKTNPPPHPSPPHPRRTPRLPPPRPRHHAPPARPRSRRRSRSQNIRRGLARRLSLVSETRMGASGRNGGGHETVWWGWDRASAFADQGAGCGGKAWEGGRVG